MTAIGEGGSTCQGAWISSLPGADLAQNTHPTINTKLSASRLHLFCRRLCKVPTPGVYIHTSRRLFAHTLQIRRWPAPSCSLSLRRQPPPAQLQLPPSPSLSGTRRACKTTTTSTTETETVFSYPPFRRYFTPVARVWTVQARRPRPSSARSRRLRAAQVNTTSRPAHLICPMSSRMP